MWQIALIKQYIKIVKIVDFHLIKYLLKGKKERNIQV